MKKTIIASFLAATTIATTASAKPGDYCVGIRGNGENVSAHWAALGKIVEEAGMPTGAAGGSSASVSLFFIESVEKNPMLNALKAKDPVLARKAQGMMFKSMPHYITTLLEVENVVSVYAFMTQLAASASKGKDGFWGAIEAAKNYDQVAKAFSRFMPLVNPEMLAGLKSPYTFNFYKGQMMKAIEVFGAFNANTDENLFVRPGLVDFKYFALWLGTIADFYAGNVDSKIAEGMEKWVGDCAELSYGKSFTAPEFKQCAEDFKTLVKTYVPQDMDSFAHRRLFDKVGERMNTFPTTSILKTDGDKKKVNKDAVQRYEALLAEFKKGNAKADFANFTLDFDTELEYGFWGPTDAKLARMKRGLSRQGDLKSSKFRALGTANWFEVLSTSPAEPGLANFQRIPVGATWEQVKEERVKSSETRWQSLSYRPELSAGGWSDLHPTIVLKSSGVCDKVVYLTRQNGDSVFGQQVFIRLTGLKEKVPFWTQIGEKDPNKIEGVKGTNRLGFQTKGTSAENTPWDRISNLGNANSSFNASIRAADVVYCTDWDTYRMFQGEHAGMIEEAYVAPVFVKKGVSFPLKSSTVQNRATDYPGCLAPEDRK